jgi:hypothetical protein
MAKGLIRGNDGNPNAALPPEQEKLRQEDHRMVKGKFINNESKGGTVKFPFKKWRGDMVEWYTLRDGEIYEIPIMVARHLNQNCAIPEWEYGVIMDSSGQMDKRIKRMDHRFSFIYSEV